MCCFFFFKVWTKIYFVKKLTFFSSARKFWCTFLEISPNCIDLGNPRRMLGLWNFVEFFKKTTCIYSYKDIAFRMAPLLVFFLSIFSKSRIESGIFFNFFSIAFPSQFFFFCVQIKGVQSPMKWGLNPSGAIFKYEAWHSVGGCCKSFQSPFYEKFIGKSFLSKIYPMIKM